MNDALQKLLDELEEIGLEIEESDKKLKEASKIVNDIKLSNEELNRLLDELLEEK